MRARIAVLAAAIAAIVAFQAAVAIPDSRAGAATDLSLSLDCDPSVSGIQSACTTSFNPHIDVVLTNNSGAAIQAGSFDFTILHAHFPALNAYTYSSGLGHDGNPDFASALTSMQWACNTPLPDGDTDADGDPATQQSFLGCSNGSANGFSVAAGASVVLARVSYYSSSANPASLPLTIQSAIFRDQTQTERGSCAAITVAMDCTGATISRVATEVTLSLDCDANTAGIQSACTQFPGALFDVDVVATNTGAAPFQLGSLGTKVLNPDISRLLAREPYIDLPDCDSSGLNCNPDFNQAAVTGNGWACNPPAPSPDDPGTTESGQDSFIGCHNGNLTGPFVASGASIVLWKIHYGVPAAAPAGDVAVSLSESGVYDESFGEIGSCRTTISIPMNCFDATVTIANVSMSVDCNATTTGIQSNCMVSNMGTTRDVRVVVTNHTTSPRMLGSFDIFLLNPDVARLFAPAINPPGDLNDNPDAAPVFSPMFWSCGPNGPSNDGNFDGHPATQESFIYCLTGGMPLNLPAMSTTHLTTIHYNIPAGADPGPVTLNLLEGLALDGDYQELGRCSTSLPVTMPCNNATLTLYCPIDQADVNNDNIVNVADMGITAANNGVLPAPTHLDQNFDGVINVADRGIIASNYSKRPTIHCP